jgi:endonuclease YncB( thermonuclease family)
MTRLLREMIRELTALPLVIKIFVAIGLTTIFVIITQWERLGFGTQGERPALAQPATSTLPQQAEQRTANLSPASALEDTDAEAAEALRLKRIGRLDIGDPLVQPDGSIKGNGQTLFLYGIKRFTSKDVCTKASGLKLACGLRAYAGLRNTIEHREIICDPIKILETGVAATCRMGKIDIALALVRDGLVELDDNVDDVALVNAQAFAKGRKLGIWDR